MGLAVREPCGIGLGRPRVGILVCVLPYVMELQSEKKRKTMLHNATLHHAFENTGMKEIKRHTKTKLTKVLMALFVIIRPNTLLPYPNTLFPIPRLSCTAPSLVLMLSYQPNPSRYSLTLMHYF